MKYVRRRFKPHDDRMIAHMPHTLQIFGDNRADVVVGPLEGVKHDVNEWCNENIGDYHREWAYQVGWKNKVVFYFTSKDYAMAFKLRWT